MNIQYPFIQLFSKQSTHQRHQQYPHLIKDFTRLSNYQGYNYQKIVRSLKASENKDQAKQWAYTIKYAIDKNFYIPKRPFHNFTIFQEVNKILQSTTEKFICLEYLSSELHGEGPKISEAKIHKAKQQLVLQKEMMVNLQISQEFAKREVNLKTIEEAIIEDLQQQHDNEGKGEGHNEGQKLKFGLWWFKGKYKEFEEYLKIVQRTSIDQKFMANKVYPFLLGTDNPRIEVTQAIIKPGFRSIFKAKHIYQTELLSHFCLEALVLQILYTQTVKHKKNISEEMFQFLISQLLVPAKQWMKVNFPLFSQNVQISPSVVNSFANDNLYKSCGIQELMKKMYEHLQENYSKPNPFHAIFKLKNSQQMMRLDMIERLNNFMFQLRIKYAEIVIVASKFNNRNSMEVYKESFEKLSHDEQHQISTSFSQMLFSNLLPTIDKNIFEQQREAAINDKTESSKKAKIYIRKAIQKKQTRQYFFHLREVFSICERALYLVNESYIESAEELQMLIKFLKLFINQNKGMHQSVIEWLTDEYFAQTSNTKIRQLIQSIFFYMIKNSEFLPNFSKVFSKFRDKSVFENSFCIILSNQILEKYPQTTEIIGELSEAYIQRYLKSSMEISISIDEGIKENCTISQLAKVSQITSQLLLKCVTKLQKSIINMLIKSYGDFDIQTKLNVTEILQQRFQQIEFDQSFLKTMNGFIDKQNNFEIIFHLKTLLITLFKNSKVSYEKEKLGQIWFYESKRKENERNVLQINLSLLELLNNFEEINLKIQIFSRILKYQSFLPLHQIIVIKGVQIIMEASSQKLPRFTRVIEDSLISLIQKKETYKKFLTINGNQMNVGLIISQMFCQEIQLSSSFVEYCFTKYSEETFFRQLIINNQTQQFEDKYFHLKMQFQLLQKKEELEINGKYHKAMRMIGCQNAAIDCRYFKNYLQSSCKQDKDEALKFIPFLNNPELYWIAQQYILLKIGDDPKKVIFFDFLKQQLLNMGSIKKETSQAVLKLFEKRKNVIFAHFELVCYLIAKSNATVNLKVFMAHYVNQNSTPIISIHATKSLIANLATPQEEQLCLQIQTLITTLLASSKDEAFIIATLELFQISMKHFKPNIQPEQLTHFIYNYFDNQIIKYKTKNIIKALSPKNHQKASKQKQFEDLQLLIDFVHFIKAKAITSNKVFMCKLQTMKIKKVAEVGEILNQMSQKCESFGQALLQKCLRFLLKQKKGLLIKAQIKVFIGYFDKWKVQFNKNGNLLYKLQNLIAKNIDEFRGEKQLQNKISKISKHLSNLIYCLNNEGTLQLAASVERFGFYFEPDYQIFVQRVLPLQNISQKHYDSPQLILSTLSGSKGHKVYCQSFLKTVATLLCERDLDQKYLRLLTNCLHLFSQFQNQQQSEFKFEKILMKALNSQKQDIVFEGVKLYTRLFEEQIMNEITSEMKLKLFDIVTKNSKKFTKEIQKLFLVLYSFGKIEPEIVQTYIKNSFANYSSHPFFQDFQNLIIVHSCDYPLIQQSTTTSTQVLLHNLYYKIEDFGKVLTNGEISDKIMHNFIEEGKFFIQKEQQGDYVDKIENFLFFINLEQFVVKYKIGFVGCIEIFKLIKSFPIKSQNGFERKLSTFTIEMAFYGQKYFENIFFERYNDELVKLKTFKDLYSVLGLNLFRIIKQEYKNEEIEEIWQVICSYSLDNVCVEKIFFVNQVTDLLSFKALLIIEYLKMNSDYCRFSDRVQFEVRKLIEKMSKNTDTLKRITSELLKLLHISASSEVSLIKPIATLSDYFDDLPQGNEKFLQYQISKINSEFIKIKNSDKLNKNIEELLKEFMQTNKLVDEQMAIRLKQFLTFKPTGQIEKQLQNQYQKYLKQVIPENQKQNKADENRDQSDDESNEEKKFDSDRLKKIMKYFKKSKKVLQIHGDHQELYHLLKLAINYYSYKVYEIEKKQLRNTQKIAIWKSVNSLIFQNQSNILQVKTGEGKSYIIGGIAFVLSFFGYKVDIITSSSVLAVRDSHQFKRIFKEMKISCSHVIDSASRPYVSGEKKEYRSQIVYGTCLQFCFDWLRHHYSRLNTKGKRDHQKQNTVLIVDQADNSMIDDILYVARLADSFPGAESLLPLYFNVWNSFQIMIKHLIFLDNKVYEVRGEIFTSGKTISLKWMQKSQQKQFSIIPDLSERIESDKRNGKSYDELEYLTCVYDQGKPIDFIVEQVQKKIEEIINLKDINFIWSEQAKNFAIKNKSIWARSLVSAVNMQQNCNYIVNQNKEIKPVDFQNTGLIQNNTSLSNGLHQFLQCKHNSPLTLETRTTNYLSFYEFFKQYQNKIIGLTGTIGGSATRKTFKQAYNCESVIIPKYMADRVHKLPTLVMSNNEEWISMIVERALFETQKGKGVLIICLTIGIAKQVYQKLKQKYKMSLVKTYLSNEEIDDNEQIKKCKKGQIIVATNLASRGTDIDASEIDQNGGLHVILTYLPSSERVQMQVFGRTARNGKMGSYQMITIKSEQYENIGEGDKLELWRNAKQLDQSDKFLKNELESLKFKDEIFCEYNSWLISVRGRLKTWQMFQKEIKSYKEVVIYEIEDRFSEIISECDKIFSSETSLQKEELKSQIKKRLQDLKIVFDQQTQNLFKLPSNKLLTSQFISQNCFLRNGCYYLKIANQILFQRTFLTVFKKKFIELLPKLIETAQILNPNDFNCHYLRAFYFIKGKNCLIGKSDHQKGYVNSALTQVKKAKTLLENELAGYQSINTILFSKKLQNEKLFLQFETKIFICLECMGSIDRIIETLEQKEEEISKQQKQARELDQSEGKNKLKQKQFDINKKLKQINSLYEKGNFPFEEISQFMNRGFVFIYDIQNRKPFPYKQIIILGLIAAVQIGIGVSLVMTGPGALIGSALIGQSLHEIFEIIKVIHKREINWKNYFISKSISIVLSAVTFGFGQLGAANMGVLQIHGEFVEKGIKSVLKSAWKHLSSHNVVEVFKQVGFAVSCQVAEKAVYKVCLFGIEFVQDQIISALRNNFAEKIRSQLQSSQTIKMWRLIEIQNTYQTISSGRNFNLKVEMQKAFDQKAKNYELLRTALEKLYELIKNQIMNSVGLKSGLIEAITNALFLTQIIINSNNEISKVIQNMMEMIHNQLNNYSQFPIHSIESFCKKQEKFLNKTQYIKSTFESFNQKRVQMLLESQNPTAKQKMLNSLPEPIQKIMRFFQRSIQQYKQTKDKVESAKFLDHPLEDQQDSQNQLNALDNDEKVIEKFMKYLNQQGNQLPIAHFAALEKYLVDFASGEFKEKTNIFMIPFTYFLAGQLTVWTENTINKSIKVDKPLELRQMKQKLSQKAVKFTQPILNQFQSNNKIQQYIFAGVLLVCFAKPVLQTVEPVCFKKWKNRLVFQQLKNGNWHRQELEITKISKFLQTQQIKINCIKQYKSKLFNLNNNDRESFDKKETLGILETFRLYHQFVVLQGEQFSFCIEKQQDSVYLSKVPRSQQQKVVCYFSSEEKCFVKRKQMIEVKDDFWKQLLSQFKKGLKVSDLKEFIQKESSIAYSILKWKHCQVLCQSLKKCLKMLAKRKISQKPLN